jgi:hypothetical protein
MNEENPYPKVEIYKYVIHTGDKLTTEEELYRKAELKYIQVKKIERILKEVAIDCPLHYSGNVFPEELEKYKNCKPGVDCPEICEFEKCEYQCYNKSLNNKYFDKNKYKKIEKEKLDYNTFTNFLARQEIDSCKRKICEIYKFKYVYNIDDIINYVKDSFTGEEYDLFDEQFVFLALDEMCPISENDFNNFKDTIYDKYNVSGYIIQRGKYYIFQPFSENEDVPIYYRTTYRKELINNLSLINYTKSFGEFKDTQVKNKKEEGYIYNREYYDTRPENDYVGIIDKNISNRKTAILGEGDIFKIRKKYTIGEKKRGVGMSTYKGAVCSVKEKYEIDEIAKSLGIKNLDNSRIKLCEMIKDKLIEKEINNKEGKTYIIIPSNHSKYKFPLNKK